jgi:nicotinamidase-related amidase
MRTLVLPTSIGMFLISLSGGFSSAEPSSAHPAIRLTAQTRDAKGQVVVESITIDPAKTAIVVIDMWDRHWCKSFTAKVGEMVTRMNPALEAAEKLGIQVVFAPSDVLDFYRDAPQRKAMQAVPSFPEPKTVAFNPPPPPGPTDICECGPQRPCQARAVWTRQHSDLKIAEQDLIGDCNNGRELMDLCAERGIDTLVYMGVASNMCVLGRSMGVRNMKDHGYRTVVVADMVEAFTSNGLDEQGKPNPAFTPAAGTAWVQRYYEQYVCPTIESRQLSAAASPSIGQSLFTAKKWRPTNPGVRRSVSACCVRAATGRRGRRLICPSSARTPIRRSWLHSSGR